MGVCKRAVVPAHRLLFGVFHVARWPVFHWPWFGSGQSRSQPCQNSPCFAHSLTLMMCGSSVLRDRVRVREGEETGERGGVQRSKVCGYAQDVHADSPSHDMMPVGVAKRLLSGRTCVQPPSVPAAVACGFIASLPSATLSSWEGIGGKRESALDGGGFRDVVSRGLEVLTAQLSYTTPHIAYRLIAPTGFE